MQNDRQPHIRNGRASTSVSSSAVPSPSCSHAALEAPTMDTPRTSSQARHCLSAHWHGSARARHARALPCLISPRCVRLLFLPPCARGRTPPARVLGELRAVWRSQGDEERVVQQRAEAQRERRGDVLLAGWSDPAPISRGGGGWRVRGAVARERCSTIAMRHAGRASCVCGPRIWPRLD